MRHHNQNRTFGRSRSQRTALMRGLAISLITYGKIATTDAKARELRPYIEKLITRSKVDNVANRRLVSSDLGEPDKVILDGLFKDLGLRFKERAGGYTRIIKKGLTSAGRQEALIEFVA